jgi:nucleoid DNA-binding protein
MQASTNKTYTREIAKRTGLKISQVKAVLDAEQDIIIRELEAKNRVIIKGFGIFEIRPHKGTSFKHPTGKFVTAVPHYRPVFTPAMPFKLRIRALEPDFIVK